MKLNLSKTKELVTRGRTTLIHDMKHERIEIKFYHLDTFKNQIDVNFIDLDSELVDLNYKVESLIFCHFWRSIKAGFH